MRIHLFFLSFITLFISELTPLYCSPPPCTDKKESKSIPSEVDYSPCVKATNRYGIEARIAYFYPTSHDFRKIYAGSGIYGLEFDCRIWRELHAWIATNYFTSSGKTEGGQNKTRVTIVPNSFGIKYIYDRFFAQPYLGIGILASYVHVHVDDSEYLIHSQSKWTAGGLFKSGCLFKVNPYLGIDLFIDYALQTIRMNSQSSKPVIVSTVNISGVSFGAGLGYQF